VCSRKQITGYAGNFRHHEPDCDNTDTEPDKPSGANHPDSGVGERGVLASSAAVIHTNGPRQAQARITWTPAAVNGAVLSSSYAARGRR
jgi:hypothetical protein